MDILSAVVSVYAYLCIGGGVVVLAAVIFLKIQREPPICPNSGSGAIVPLPEMNTYSDGYAAPGHATFTQTADGWLEDATGRME